MGISVFERTHLRKSGTLSRRPQCCGKPTIYTAQPAMNAKNVSKNIQIHWPVTIETMMTVAWKANCERAHQIVRRCWSG